MSTVPKSMFVPPTILGKNELSMSLGTSFYRDQYNQGFDGTGKYFFILIDEFEDFDTTIFALYFDNVANSIEKKQIQISIPIEFECERLSLLFPFNGKVVHTVKYEVSNDEKTIVDFYFIDVFDLLNKSDQSEEVFVIDKKPDITLHYDKEKFNRILFERCGINNVASTLLVQGYCRYREDRWYYRYRPEICIDVLHINKNRFIHFQRVECNLEIFSVGIYHPMSTFYTKQRLFFSGKAVKT